VKTVEGEVVSKPAVTTARAGVGTERRVRPRRWLTATVGAFAVLAATWFGTSTSATGTSPAATTGTSSPTSVRSLLAPGAKVRLFAGGLGYAEGPLWLPDGRLIVSDVYGNAVLAFDAAGKKSVFRRPSNRANGHALDAHGSVIEAEAGNGKNAGRIAKIAADGTATMLADSFRGKPFIEPNDLIVKRDGTIWFTDPNLGLVPPLGSAVHGVYRLDPKTKVVTRLTKALNAPNGIAFSPDQKTLYVTDYAGDGLVSFPITTGDTLGPERHLQITGCDGVGVDERGNIWATTCSSYILITNPVGKEIGEIDVPGTTTNLAWGGSHGKTLFITTQEGRIYSLALTVREAH
jgi:gluconolactonase